MIDYKKILEQRQAIYPRKKKNQRLLFEIDIENGYKFCKHCNQNRPLEHFNLQLAKEFPLFFNKCKICGGFKGKPTFITRNGKNLKKCSKCKEYKEYSEFGTNRYKREGIDGKCKVCKLAHGRIHQEKNKEQIKEYRKENRKKNILKIKERKREYYSNTINKEKRNKKRRDRYKTDIEFKFLLILRGRMRVVLNGFRKSDTTKELLGRTMDEFKTYIQSLFGTNMTWENYGENGWELEHILPCKLFDLSDDRQQKVCFHYTNLKPMWYYLNRSKQDRLDDGRYAYQITKEEKLQYLKEKGYDFTVSAESNIVRPNLPSELSNPAGDMIAA